MDIGVIFTAAGAVKSIAEFLGVIDSLEAKVDRLVRSELNAGFRNLDQARVSEKEREHLLREARGCFNKAVSLESGFRRGLALLGCATCHHLLTDSENVRPCLEELVALPPAVGLGAHVKAHLAEQARDHLLLPGLGQFVRLYRTLKSMTSEQARIAERKRVVIEAVSWSIEAKSLLQLQQAVATYIDSPVRWLDDLDNGRF